MNDLSVLRGTLMQKLVIHIMKAKKRESKEVSITVDKIWDSAVDAWNKIRSSKHALEASPSNFNVVNTPEPAAIELPAIENPITLPVLEDAETENSAAAAAPPSATPDNDAPETEN